MKKNNLIKNLSAKKTSVKGVILESAKESEKLKVQSAKLQRKIQSPERFWKLSRRSGIPLLAGKIGNWKFVSLALASSVIVIVIVIYQFLPQSARSKTFTFFQTTWSSVVATAVHNPDAQIADGNADLKYFHYGC